MRGVGGEPLAEAVEDFGEGVGGIDLGLGDGGEVFAEIGEDWVTLGTDEGLKLVSRRGGSGREGYGTDLDDLHFIAGEGTVVGAGSFEIDDDEGFRHGRLLDAYYVDKVGVEDGGGEAEGIDEVESPADSGEEFAGVLGSEAALYDGFCEVAEDGHDP